MYFGIFLRDKQRSKSILQQMPCLHGQPQKKRLAASNASFECWGRAARHAFKIIQNLLIAQEGKKQQAGKC